MTPAARDWGYNNKFMNDYTTDDWQLVSTSADWSNAWMNSTYGSTTAPITISSAAGTTQQITINVADVKLATQQLTAAVQQANHAWQKLAAANIKKPMRTYTGAKRVPQSALTAPALRRAPDGFNKYVNGSDLLDEFIAFVGAEGVRRGEVMSLPIELFIKWLIVRACEEDQVEPNVTLDIPRRPSQPRCLVCQKWMSRSARVPLHGDVCAPRYFARELEAA